MAKRSLTRYYRAVRHRTCAQERAAWDEVICRRILALLAGHQTVAVYCSFDHEVDMRFLIRALLAIDGTIVCVPWVQGDDLVFKSIKGWGDVQPGTWNIPEPTTDTIVEPWELDAIVVPMVAFNRSRYRLGFGKGYYDRFLVQTTALKIGAAYGFQETQVNFQQSHDIPCDIIVTEREVIGSMKQ